MGVYYDASIVWGLFVPDSDELYGVDFTDVYTLPEGFQYSMGGDLMDHEDVGYVVHPRGAATTVLDSLSQTESFGVFAIDGMYTHQDGDYTGLVNFADKYGLRPLIGWFAVSSIG